MSEQTQLYYDENLRVVDAAVSRYEQWWDSAGWIFRVMNPKPKAMHGDLVRKMIQSNQLPPGADPGGLDWSVKLALASGSVVALVVVVLWALRKVGK